MCVVHASSDLQLNKLEEFSKKDFYRIDMFGTPIMSLPTIN